MTTRPPGRPRVPDRPIEEAERAAYAAGGYSLADLWDDDRDPALMEARRRVAQDLSARGWNQRQIAEALHRGRPAVRNLLSPKGVPWARRLAVLLLLFPAPAFAADLASFRGSTAHLEPTDAPGAVAQVRFVNRRVNGPQDHGQRATVTRDGLEVDIEFLWFGPDDPDGVRIEPPGGYIAVPPELIVDEDGEGVSLIYPVGGVS